MNNLELEEHIIKSGDKEYIYYVDNKGRAYSKNEKILIDVINEQDSLIKNNIEKILNICHTIKSHNESIENLNKTLDLLLKNFNILTDSFKTYIISHP